MPGQRTPVINLVLLICVTRDSFSKCYFMQRWQMLLKAVRLLLPTVRQGGAMIKNRCFCRRPAAQLPIVWFQTQGAIKATTKRCFVKISHASFAGQSSFLNSCDTLITAGLPCQEWRQWSLLHNLVKNRNSTPPRKNSLPILISSDHSQIPCGELMHARSQCYLADLGSEEQRERGQEPTERSMRGTGQMLQSLKKRLRGRV